MNVALVLFLGGVVVTLWLFFWTRQRSLGTDYIQIGESDSQPEAVIMLRGLGQVVYVNDTLRQWLEISDALPDTEQIARQIRPIEGVRGRAAA